MDFVSHYSSSRPSPSVTTGDGLTQQQFKEESDINVIVNRYKTTGRWSISLVQPEQVRTPMYLDLTDFNTESGASVFDTVANVNSIFNGLSAEQRERFGNPAAMVEFAANPSNFEECVRIGLFEADLTRSEGSQVSEVPSTQETPKTAVSEGAD